MDVFDKIREVKTDWIVDDMKDCSYFSGLLFHLFFFHTKARMDEKITKVNILKKEIMKTEKVVNETSKCITFYKCVPCFELFEYTTRKVKFKNLK